MSRSNVLWLEEPEEHDYCAASEYLFLLGVNDSSIGGIIDAMKENDTIWFQAKNILRASGLPLLDKRNEHVNKDLKKVEDGKRLSPILLVRGDMYEGLPLIVADGYHRVCASYYLDENTEIPTRIF